MGQRKSYNFPESMVILTTADPTQGGWELACEPHFGDPSNLSVFQMVEFNGFLYVGTMNVSQGFQIWKTDAEGVPPFKWKKVVEKGAYRGKLNQGAITMQPFGKYLYIGTGIQEGGYDRYNNVGPGAAEIIRIGPDDTWDLVVGEPRLTPQGLKMPISGLDSGFGKPFAGYLWSMCVHEGWLYAGTFDWLMAVRYGNTDRWPEYVRRMLDPKQLESLIKRFGGFDLWRTRDGHSWIPVTQTGFGNLFNVGARTMTSTPCGLFVGTANSFAPDVAVERIAGWNYEENPIGGLEVWLGSRPEPLTKPWAGSGIRFIPPTHYPHSASKGVEDVRAQIISELYGNTRFRHLGFWTADTHDLIAACKQLMEEILAFLPRRAGTIVDLGCGLGGSTSYLLKYYAPGAVTGITINKKDLSRCREREPQAKFVFRKLPKLKLPPESADAVICVKSLKLWTIGPGLLKEIYQTLKPTGQLVCFDTVSAQGLQDGGFTRPRNQFFESISEYEDLIRDIGFGRVLCSDVTAETLYGFQKFIATYLEIKQLAGQIDDRIIQEIRTDFMLDGRGLCRCVLLSAQKEKDPVANGPPEAIPVAQPRQ
jgi:ubiquinone/menaquinone biosynthesis C-methylase UbiE